MARPSILTRREILAAAAATALSSGTARAQGRAVKPNIVYIMADDMGYADLSCYGRREYKTPNIDSIAAGGVKFLQAYANSSVCSATRTALITGRYQYRLRVGLEEPLAFQSRYGLPPEHPTFPSLLKKAGYGTTLIGKWHLGGLPNFGPLKSGYDHFWGFRWGALDYFTHKYGTAGTDTEDLWDDDVKIHQAGYLTDLMGDRAVKVIGDYAKAGEPFLLSLHFNAPHWPWEGPGDEAESQRIRALVDRDGGSMKTYAQMVTRMDMQVGRVLKALGDGEIANSTIVVFTSDNGGERFSDTWPFTGKKEELLEGGLRIPALVRWPGHIRAGSTTDQVGITMDWMPTFLAAAGGAPDPGVSVGWNESAAADGASSRARFTQALLALSLQLAARHARRRHEVLENRRERVSVQRRRRSPGTRQPEGAPARRIQADGAGLRRMERDHAAGSERRQLGASGVRG